jgi:DNA-directed RNA polymerase subunit RPC12/RpoP
MIVKRRDLSCPACGFGVFNRRYPKCERCGAELPASVVFSDQERRALLDRECSS